MSLTHWKYIRLWYRPKPKVLLLGSVTVQKCATNPLNLKKLLIPCYSICVTFSLITKCVPSLFNRTVIENTQLIINSQVSHNSIGNPLFVEMFAQYYFTVLCSVNITSIPY